MKVTTMLRIEETELRSLIAEWLVNKLDQSQIGETSEEELAKMLRFESVTGKKIDVVVEGLEGEL
jgi:hypothetical protein